MLVQEFIHKMEAFAPLIYSEEGDPIGLHFGKEDNEIHRLMVTLDVRPEVVEEAINQKVDFIFAHHPPIFVPIKTFNESDPQIAMYAKLIRHHIGVYAAHTNLDSTKGGLNDALAQAYGIEKALPLLPQKEKGVGLGRVGELKEPQLLSSFIEKVKKVHHLSAVKIITKEPNQMVKRVAVLGGAGSREFEEAIKYQADVYVTADVTYHTGHDILESGLTVIDAGHHMEAIMMPLMVKKINEWKKEENWSIEVLESTINTDPFQLK